MKYYYAVLNILSVTKITVSNGFSHHGKGVCIIWR